MLLFFFAWSLECGPCFLIVIFCLVGAFPHDCLQYGGTALPLLLPNWKTEVGGVHEYITNSSDFSSSPGGGLAQGAIGVISLDAWKMVQPTMSWHDVSKICLIYLLIVFGCGLILYVKVMALSVLNENGQGTALSPLLLWAVQRWDKCFWNTLPCLILTRHYVRQFFVNMMMMADKCLWHWI